jgi:hypothetical protein
MNATTGKGDELLDAALQMTFPASDPIAVDALVRRRGTAMPGATRRPRGHKPAAEPDHANEPGASRA